MIQRKKKKCKGCGEDKYLFGRGLCQYCYGKDQSKRNSGKVKKSKSISQISTQNTFSDSYGNRYTKEEINAKVSEAKRNVIERQKDTYGYNFCVTCGRSNCTPLDASHLVSVNEAQNLGKVEIAWDEADIIPEGRNCHMETEKQSHKERMKRYLKNKVEFGAN